MAPLVVEHQPRQHRHTEGNELRPTHSAADIADAPRMSLPRPHRVATAAAWRARLQRDASRILSSTVRGQIR